MRSWVIWPWLWGCSFSPATGMATDGDVPVAPDGPADSQVISDAVPAAPGCELVPLGQVACYQFEGDLATFVDGSGNHHDALATGFSPVTRDVPVASQAIEVGAAASAKVPQSSAFDLNGNFTITAWIRPAGPDPGANEGIVDHEGAWAMSIDHGLLRCWSNRNNGLFTIATPTFVDNAWQLVACTVSGNSGCVHQIGSDATHTRKCAMANANGTDGTNGFTIGSFQNGAGAVEERFGGAIDDLRIYARALSAAELCTLAGHATCMDNPQ